jgi:hypothetical protein
LEQEFAGRVKCVFIDPPYNTGSAFTHYDDGLEHSIWLGLMRDRLEIIRSLLADDGSLWITIDDNECHYLKVLCDDVIGLVGEIMANSALAQTLTQPSNTPLAGSSAGAIPVVPTVTSKPSVAANNSQNSTTKPVKKQTTEEPKTDSEKNDSEKTKTDVNNNTSDKKNTQSDSADKKSVKKSESTTSNADTKSTKPVSHEKVPTDTNVKLTIEEKNEQY